MNRKLAALLAIPVLAGAVGISACSSGGGASSNYAAYCSKTLNDLSGARRRFGVASPERES
jgi:hypothetical protein